ncbi:MAG: hypothetical protein ACYC4N_27685 [Pirellulaceae bacterium]
MTCNPERQYDESQQTAVWSEEVSNEGHVHAALGVSQQEIDTWMQRDLKLVQQNGNYGTVAARNAADHQRWYSGQVE